MPEDTIELEVRRETLRNHLPEEFSLPAVETDEGVSYPAKTKQQVTRAHIQLTALCMSLFLAGWNDGTTGPLLPRIQSVYNVCSMTCSPFFQCPYSNKGQLYHCIVDICLFLCSKSYSHCFLASHADS